MGRKEAGAIAELTRTHQGHYKGPAIHVGAIVLWYPEPSKATAPLPAIVVRLNNENLCLSAHHWEIKDHVIKEGVFHHSDPRCRNTDLSTEGCWDYTDGWKDAQSLKSRVEGFEAMGLELATAPG